MSCFGPVLVFAAEWLNRAGPECRIAGIGCLGCTGCKGALGASRAQGHNGAGVLGGVQAREEVPRLANHLPTRQFLQANCSSRQGQEHILRQREQRNTRQAKQARPDEASKAGQDRTMQERRRGGVG